MENENNIWYFTKEQLEDSPSRRSGIDASKELSYRQQAANFIQDMGQRLQVSQLCINTAIVYMHRFYVFHSFVKIHRNNVAICALFLAAKVEEQPRKLEHVIKVSHMCLHRDEPPLDVRSELYLEKQAELVQYENIMLQTLGFNIGIEHPHTYVVKLCQLVKASKDLAQTSYFMATNSLHLTTMCLQHKPTIVASVCIHLACKWSNWKIEKCKEGKEWFYYVDKSVTLELLEDLTKEFIQIMENCPNRLKRRVVTSNGKDSQYSERCRPEQASGRAEKEKAFEIKQLVPKKGNSPLPSSSFIIKEENEIPSSSGSAILESTSVSCSPAKKIKIESSSSAPISLAAYREKREKERQEQKIVPSELPTSSQNHSIDGRHPKHMINHEKIRPFVPHIKQADRMLGNVKPLEKSNKEIISTISDVEPTGFGKFNHQSPRLPIDSHHLKDNKHIIKGLIKNVSEDIKSNCETPTVLKRVNCAEVADQPDSTENFLDANTQVFRMRHEEELKMRTKPHTAIEHKVPESERTARKMPTTVVPNKVPKIKQHKNITISSSNSHEKLLPMPQVNTLKHSPNVDSAKANGSKIIELLPDHQPPPFFEAISSRPSVPSSNKPERKERHKHKHYLPNKEKTSNHRIVEASSEQNHPVGLKITIPKDKIVLSGIHQELSHKSNSVKSEDQGKKSLKIKIPKPKVVCDETKVGVKASPAGSSIKLVFTKNKNADSYSTTQIQDKSSRKRDRSSPKTSESNSRNSHPASKPPKSARLDQTRSKSHYHQDNISAPIPSEQKFSHHPHHVEIEQQNYSTNKQVNSQWVYHPMNDGSHLSQCVMPPFGTQQCPPSYFPHPQPLLINANMFQNQIMPHLSFGHLQPPPPPPPSAGPPPLPRDPPPPLPPQPPPPIE